MDEILKKIMDFLSANDEVQEIEYLGPEMKGVCYVTMKDGRRLILSLLDAGLPTGN